MLVDAVSWRANCIVNRAHACAVSVFANFPFSTHFHVPTHIFLYFSHVLTWSPLVFHNSCHVYNVLCDSLRFFLLWNMNVCTGCLAPVAIRHALDLLLPPSHCYSAPCLSVVDMFEEWPSIHVHVSMIKLILSVFEFVVYLIQVLYSIYARITSISLLCNFFSPSVCLFS